MALLGVTPLPCVFSPPLSSSSTSFPIAVSPVSRLRLKVIDPWPSKHSIGTQFVPNKEQRLTRTVKASAASTDGEPQPPPPPPSESKPPVEQLPLESDAKKQQLMEQRLKMKLAKKIRLRRKRLLRKRKMRKKGRWPPSKMNKLKNV